MTQSYARDFSKFLSLYRDACDWFSSLGLEWAATRYGAYEKHFANFEEFSESGDTSSVDIEMKRDFDNAYLEANEIVRVYSELHRFEQTEYIVQLKTILGGQEYRGLSDNDQARDFLFELSTAARFLCAGYEVLLSGDCDIVAEIPEGMLFIECKRMKSAKKIPKNIKKASDQIKKRIGKKPSKKMMGLIAANITDLVPGPSSLSPDSPKAAFKLQRALANSALSKHAHGLIPKSTSKRLLGVMVECSAIWYLSQRSPVSGIAYARHTNFIQHAQPGVIEALAPRICNQDILK